MELTTLQNQVLSTRLINILSKLYFLKNISVPRWILIIGTETSAIMLHVSIWKVANPQTVFDWAAFAWIYWGTLITGVIVIFVDQNVDYFLKVTSEILPRFAFKENAFLEWKTRTFNLRYQVIFSLVFAVVIFPTAYLYFDLIIGSLINFGSLILFLNLILIGNGFYWLWFLPSAIRAIKQSIGRLNYFDLKNTNWIDQFSDVYSKAALYASIIGVMIIFPIAFGPKSGNVVIITSSWLVLVWLLVLVPYFNAQNNISKLINRERLRTIDDLQNQIAHYLSLQPTDAREKRLANLITIYNKALDAKGSAFSSNPQIANSIVIPLLSFVIINFDKIVSLIRTLF